MNRQGIISVTIGLLLVISLFLLSGVRVNSLLFGLMFIPLTIVGLTLAIKSKKGIYIIVGGLLNGLLLIYSFLLFLIGMSA
ncbi:hypothetical protein [Kurthia senegalensis]|uniref:hypothetical protein n=1 Tax=Kurthia senegalensis TaxID=1033740 RepID=UPI000289B152|nr:hypothetical protein [Kurthia senegalensis]